MDLQYACQIGPNSKVQGNCLGSHPTEAGRLGDDVRGIDSPPMDVAEQPSEYCNAKNLTGGAEWCQPALHVQVYQGAQLSTPFGTKQSRLRRSVGSAMRKSLRQPAFPQRKRPVQYSSPPETARREYSMNHHLMLRIPPSIGVHLAWTATSRFAVRGSWADVDGSLVATQVSAVK